MRGSPPRPELRVLQETLTAPGRRVFVLNTTGDGELTEIDTITGGTGE